MSGEGGCSDPQQFVCDCTKSNPSENDSNCPLPVLLYDDVNPKVRSVLLLINKLNVNIPLQFVDTLSNEHMTDEYRKINPASTVPTLIDNNLVLFTSPAILVHLASNYGGESLYPSNFDAQMRIMNMLFFDLSVLYRRHGAYMTALIRSGKQYKLDEFYGQRILESYQVLEDILRKSCYMALNTITLADYGIMGTLTGLDLLYPIEKYSSEFPKLLNWFHEMKRLPEFSREVLTGIEKEKLFIQNLSDNILITADYDPEAIVSHDIEHIEHSSNENSSPPMYSIQSALEGDAAERKRNSKCDCTKGNFQKTLIGEGNKKISATQNGIKKYANTARSKTQSFKRSTVKKASDTSGVRSIGFKKCNCNDTQHDTIRENNITTRKPISYGNGQKKKTLGVLRESSEKSEQVFLKNSPFRSPLNSSSERYNMPSGNEFDESKKCKCDVGKKLGYIEKKSDSQKKIQMHKSDRSSILENITKKAINELVDKPISRKVGGTTYGRTLGEMRVSKKQMGEIDSDKKRSKDNFNTEHSEMEPKQGCSCDGHSLCDAPGTSKSVGKSYDTANKKPIGKTSSNKTISQKSTTVNNMLEEPNKCPCTKEQRKNYTHLQGTKKLQIQRGLKPSKTNQYPLAPSRASEGTERRLAQRKQLSETKPNTLDKQIQAELKTSSNTNVNGNDKISKDSEIKNESGFAKCNCYDGNRSRLLRISQRRSGDSLNPSKPKIGTLKGSSDKKKNTPAEKPLQNGDLHKKVNEISQEVQKSPAKVFPAEYKELSKRKLNAFTYGKNVSGEASISRKSDNHSFDVIQNDSICSSTAEVSKLFLATQNCLCQKVSQEKDLDSGAILGRKIKKKKQSGQEGSNKVTLKKQPNKRVCKGKNVDGKLNECQCAKEQETNRSNNLKNLSQPAKKLTAKKVLPLSEHGQYIFKDCGCDEGAKPNLVQRNQPVGKKTVIDKSIQTRLKTTAAGRTLAVWSDKNMENTDIEMYSDSFAWDCLHGRNPTGLKENISSTTKHMENVEDITNFKGISYKNNDMHVQNEQYFKTNASQAQRSSKNPVNNGKNLIVKCQCIEDQLKNRSYNLKGFSQPTKKLTVKKVLPFSENSQYISKECVCDQEARPNLMQRNHGMETETVMDKSIQTERKTTAAKGTLTISLDTNIEEMDIEIVRDSFESNCLCRKNPKDSEENIGSTTQYIENQVQVTNFKESSYRNNTINAQKKYALDMKTDESVNQRSSKDAVSNNSIEAELINKLKVGTYGRPIRDQQLNKGKRTNKIEVSNETSDDTDFNELKIEKSICDTTAELEMDKKFAGCSCAKE